jgi:hypothetical protein
VELEHLGDGPEEWYAEGPGGSAIGPLASVIGEAAGPHADVEWQAIAVATIQREVRAGEGRVGLIVRRGSGVLFHATRAANRESIARHGLDWRRMQRPGVAGSSRPEARGIFLCGTLESARWFAGMVRGEPADIWRVVVEGRWLVSDSSASGGLDDEWVIATEAIPADALELAEGGLVASGRG